MSDQLLSLFQPLSKTFKIATYGRINLKTGLFYSICMFDIRLRSGSLYIPNFHSIIDTLLTKRMEPQLQMSPTQFKYPTHPAPSHNNDKVGFPLNRVIVSGAPLGLRRYILNSDIMWHQCD